MKYAYAMSPGSLQPPDRMAERFIGLGALLKVSQPLIERASTIFTEICRRREEQDWRLSPIRLQY